MQKNIRISEGQLLYLANKARVENTMCGYLYKRSTDLGKWQQRYFVLYQNVLFYYENENSTRPSGVALLEGSYCDRIIAPAAMKGRETDKQYAFTITYKIEGQRQYDLRSESEVECNAWIDAIKRASYSKVLEQKEELEQKHLHLLQILDSERQAKWHYVQQTEELACEVKKLKEELQKFKKEVYGNHCKVDEETDDLKKIKKVAVSVQSFFRGWLCRRRWKQIVELYIRSPHAESMRKRNSIVFSMVECEEEYNRQLSCLVTCFLRPLRMAASSKKPPISHEDVNSIFLNSETLLFLHQIFLKGLTARLENWPTLVLGDLFDMLLPMLSIYQEYVRNHHYSLQVLAEYKQKFEFNNLLKRYEEKPACEGRTLETFLTYPMHQIPRYIITLHELLAHTPHDHVERESLEFAKSKLEELSRVMHDEVSETENIRKNLAIERMIVEGCDILLDVNQTFVRQGPLLQILNEKGKSNRGRLGSFSSSFKESKKEVVRQVFLFTNHILLTTRASNGRLHLAKHIGKIVLLDCTLIEDPNSDIFFFDEETSSLDSNLSLGSQTSAANLLPLQGLSEKESKADYNGLDFRLIVDSKSGPPVTITLVASTLHEKAAWCSDISQCIENLHYSDLLNSSMSESSSVTMPQSVRYIHSTQIWSDPKLFRDDVDIKFSRTLNSCKVPQIRHASVERLLDRLTDLRFLSIDFLNTFLLTYRVFTTGHTLLEALKKVYKSHEGGANHESGANLTNSLTSVAAHCQTEEETAEDVGSPPEFTGEPPEVDARFVIKPQAEKMRRISTGCMRQDDDDVSVSSSTSSPRASFSTESSRSSFQQQHPLTNLTQKFERGESVDSDDSRSELTSFLQPPKPRALLAPIASCETLNDQDIPDIPSITRQESGSPTGIILSDFDLDDESSADYVDTDDDKQLLTPSMASTFAGSLSSESLVSPSSPRTITSAVSSDTLTPGTPKTPVTPRVSPFGSPKRVPVLGLGLKSGKLNGNSASGSPKRPSTPSRVMETSYTLDALALSPSSSPIRIIKPRPMSSPVRIPSPLLPGTQKRASSPGRITSSPVRSPTSSPKLRRAPSPISYSYSSPNIVAPQIKIRPFSGKRGSAEAESISMLSTPRSSFAQVDGSPPTRAKAGTVVTSSRASKRRSSSSAATTAFAAATAGLASCADQQQKGISRYLSVGTGTLDARPVMKKRESVISTAATMRVLNVLKHWVSKHQQDFESDPDLKQQVIDLLDEMVVNSNLLPAEHKAAASILRTISKEPSPDKKVDLTQLLLPPASPSKDNLDTLSALDIAEQLTYLDHQIFIAIRSEELLSQAWMKPDKCHKAQHVLLVSKRFNEVSRLVVSEIVSRSNMQDRVACIEKWAAIADICRCMHNYNGVLQICAALVNSSVYRLKKTWEKLSKQTKQMIDRLQTLVSSEGRFKNMRDALHRCDPPCIPYLGMYLTDLSFIEEGTPNTTEDGLVNFSKMRMIAHVIREIRLFQQTSYKIEHHSRVTSYLLDPSRLLDDDQTYKASLEIEPKQSRLSVISTPS
ncbi:ras-specific guanine nucleotide-releasing factor 2-like isoform X5 [Biomphalaria glabrata]|uniref:Ras-specific guanine nucleotide-releasing factor 2-like isoform X5 n=1 Tax=Biomphalaria glabrata TaxID=6526 RepID=A0A9W2ZZX0_BIOGL|nr:ras-specific guanine nucleotide-releasing factor 2-like isoform X5 [Biomphalaria glabrata]